MPRPVPHPDGRATRLLAATLRPEARPMAGVLAILLTSMVLRLALPLVLGRFADSALAGEPTSALTTLALAYVAAALGSALLDLVVVWWSARVSWRAGNRLRERLAAHALRLEQAWHSRHSPGQLIERIDGDVAAMAIFFAGMAVQIAGNVALIIGMLVVATTIDPLTGLILAATATAGAGVLIRLRMAAVSAREAEREVNAQLYGDLEERLGGLEDLRANGAGRYAVHRLHVNSARSWRAARHASLRGDGAYAAAAIVFAVGTAATIAAGVLLQQRGVVTVGAVLTLYRYADVLRKPLEQIAEQLKEFQKAMAGARRAATLLATEPAIADGPDDGSALPHGALSVDLDHVTFAYGTPTHHAPGTPVAPGPDQPADVEEPTRPSHRSSSGSGHAPTPTDATTTADLPPADGAITDRTSAREAATTAAATDGEADLAVLRDVTLSLGPGRHLGLVGRTGSGKTTIGRLIARTWDVPRDGGAVRLGGVDVRDLTIGALRSRVAVVTQDVEIFRATVRDNLTSFGTRDADDDRLRSVLDLVGLADWVAALPHGLDTHLDGTQGLSAGEGQLVALARAFLAEPGVVVLDEASSRLDPSTEQRIVDATTALLAGRTAVIIAHRLDTLDRVDEIAVLDGGRVVEHGLRVDLARDPASSYARLRRAGSTTNLDITIATPAEAPDPTVDVPA